MNCTAEGKTGGPTPWYLPKFANGASTSGDKTWKNFEQQSLKQFRVALANSAEQFLLLIGFYWYTCAIADDLFLIWRHFLSRPRLPGQPGEVQFHLLDVNELSPISDLHRALIASDDDGTQGGIYYDGEPMARQSYVAAFRPGITRISVSEQFNKLGSVLVLADVGSCVGYEALAHMAILDFNFQNESVTCYPQDWFNNGGLDYGYQWITRVWRDEKGRICGDGFRISEFRLDESGRHIDRSFLGLL